MLKKRLAAAKWYHSDISREDMKDLMQRRDLPAIRDTLIYYLLLLSTAIQVFCYGALFIVYHFGWFIHCFIQRVPTVGGMKQATERHLKPNG